MGGMQVSALNWKLPGKAIDKRPIASPSINGAHSTGWNKSAASEHDTKIVLENYQITW
jgi:hypothetical protein